MKGIRQAWFESDDHTKKVIKGWMYLLFLTFMGLSLLLGLLWGVPHYNVWRAKLWHQANLEMENLS